MVYVNKYKIIGEAFASFIHLISCESQLLQTDIVSDLRLRYFHTFKVEILLESYN